MEVDKFTSLLRGRFWGKKDQSFFLSSSSRNSALEVALMVLDLEFKI